MSIAEKLATITANQERVYNKGFEVGYDDGNANGKLELLNASKYMNGKATSKIKYDKENRAIGSFITLNDVSYVEHDIRVRVSGENLLPYPYSSTGDGVLCIINEDHSITLKSGYMDDFYFLEKTSLPNGINHNETYTFSIGTPLPNIGADVRIMFFDSVDGAIISDAWIIAGEREVTFTVPSNADEMHIYLYGITNQLEEDITFYPKLFHNVDLSRVKIEKNLIPNNIDCLNMIRYKRSEDNISDYLAYVVKLPAGSYTIKTTKIYDLPQTIPAYFYHMALYEDGTLIKNIGGSSYNHPVGDGIIQSPISFEVIEDTNRQPIKYFYYVLYHANSQANANARYIKEQFSCLDFLLTKENDMVEYSATSDGVVEGIKSVCNDITLRTNTEGIDIECSYLRDIDIYINNQIMNVAMTGGE